MVSLIEESVMKTGICDICHEKVDDMELVTMYTEDDGYADEFYWTECTKCNKQFDELLKDIDNENS